MISLYSGTPGSYKSYHAVVECLDWLRMGRNVITNFKLDYAHKIKKPIKGDYRFMLDDDITVEFLVQYAQEHHIKSHHAQTLVVIDEASIKFNPREFGRRDRMPWIRFFATHRHLNYEFILIAQNDRMIDRQIRGLIETEYKHRDVKQFNNFFFVLSKLFGGVFLSVEYWYPVKLRSGSKFEFFRKRIAECYDTMASFGEIGLGGEKVENKEITDSQKQRTEQIALFIALLNARINYLNENGTSTKRRFFRRFR